ncbi:MAG: patatin-like phospholipase family protein [Candidatus Saccharibacteria bacterium]|nr:patatin-like phospholipase family protein [Pseudorhodobacter sp.]
MRARDAGDASGCGDCPQQLPADRKSRQVICLCIPAFDGTHEEVFVYKTPHHPDYKFDRREKTVNIGLATSAAPSFFAPLKNGPHHLVDGGVWANNPIILAMIEALICFDIEPTQVDVLGIGCRDDPYLAAPDQLGRIDFLEGRNLCPHAPPASGGNKPSAPAAGAAPHNRCSNWCIEK